MNKLALTAAILLASCGQDNKSSLPLPPAEQLWRIGPIVDGQNYSADMPLYVNGNSFDFPLSPGHVNYITKSISGLSGKTKIVLRYRVEAGTNVKFLPKCCPLSPALGPTLYFQRRGDDWNTDGWRWWSTFATKTLEPGEYEITTNLNENWTSVETMTARANPVEFKEALDNAAQVGFTFGGGDGFGHGVYATGPAKFIIEEFSIE